MKTFSSSAGFKVLGETMTVKELREKLSEYPDDMPVFGEWEGCYGFIIPQNFSTVRTGKGYADDICDCLLIDVNDY